MIEPDTPSRRGLAGMLKSQTLRTWAACLLPMLPMLYLVALIDRHGVDVPYADEFSLAPILAKASSNSITFADLWAQHNEHRYVFPRLIFILFARFADSDFLRAEMFFSAFLAALVAVLLWALIRRTITQSLQKSLLLSSLVTLLLFSPVQAENWTWGFQFVLFLANLFCAAGVVLAFSRQRIELRFFGCLLIAIVATFSFGNGILLWVLTFPAAIILGRLIGGKLHLGWLVGWTFSAIGTLTPYFIDFHRPGQIPTIGYAGTLKYFAYVAAFLGSHLSRANSFESSVPAICAGTTLLGLYSAAAYYAFRHIRDSQVLTRMFPWFCLGAYAILSACFAAAARIGFGVQQALDSRYTSFSLYLSIGAIGLVTIAGQHIRSCGLKKYGHHLLRAETALLTAFLCSCLTAYVWGSQTMKATERSRRIGKAALLFANVLDSGSVYEKHLIANASDARRFTNQLDQIGLFHPRLYTSADISMLPLGKPAQAGPPSTNPSEGRTYKVAGFIDSLQQAGSRCRLTGWALLPRKGRIADGVVVGHKTEGGSASVFQVADQNLERPDVGQLFGLSGVWWCGWRLDFDRSLLPPGEQTVLAWAVDSESGLLYQIPGAQPLK